MQVVNFLHPEVRRYLPELQRASQYLRAQVESAQDITLGELSLADSTLRLIGAKWLVPNVLLSFQYLSDVGLSYMQQVQAGLTWATNDAELAPYQIPEALLQQQQPALAVNLAALHEMVLSHVWSIAFGLVPSEHNSVQIAKYSAGHPGSGWHYDQDSECTTTVALLGEHTGGGMRVFGSDVVWHSQPGEAFLFKGATTLHRSNPVTAGERNLLVHWVDRE